MSDDARVQAPLRFWRSGVITACGLGVAAAAHTAGGGNLPPVQVMLLLAVLCLCPVTLLARRQLRMPAMAGILGAGQAALHAAFTALSGPSAHCTDAAVAAHGHHAAAVPECAAGVGYAAGAVTAGAVAGLPAPVMLMAHLLAVAVTAVLLARGEAALWQVRAWLAPLAAVVHPVVLPPAVRVAALRSEAGTPRFSAVRIPPRRGPPALFGRAVPAFRMPASCLPA